MSEKEKLLLATNNMGKLREYQSAFRGLPYELVTLAQTGITTAIDEEGESFEENAKIKAAGYAALSGLLSLADDSGLEVDALGGEPGPRSARYAGTDATDSKRVSYLLSRLAKVPWERRTGRFRCVIALAMRGGEIGLCAGECEGYITFVPRGGQGFGYDPVFYLPEQDRTMAELPLEVKNRISHRGQAARKAYRLLRARKRAL